MMDDDGGAELKNDNRLMSGRFTFLYKKGHKWPFLYFGAQEVFQFDLNNNIYCVHYIIRED